jgi:hypothetical protein
MPPIVVSHTARMGSLLAAFAIMLKEVRRQRNIMTLFIFS